MTTSEREERRLAFYRAAAWIAKEKHGKQFSELSNSDGAKVVGEVYARHPELRSAFDEPVGGVGTVEPPPPSGDADWSQRPATRSVAERYGFSAADVAADPLKRSLVSHVGRCEEQADSFDEFDTAIRAVGKAHGLSPDVYSERLEIGKIMARQHHPLAGR